MNEDPVQGKSVTVNGSRRLFRLHDNELSSGCEGAK